ncbi:hypothetical protein JZ751_011611 [Albula glossodonta]|uniref:Uncharacterized protein n=1 Tax=Albula glossodonta TaxID=121402 RepID=A0A8T2N1Y2_9TELE|nr:hypothetical protein JZ751_011611 [Albula glossodonta]
MMMATLLGQCGGSSPSHYHPPRNLQASTDHLCRLFHIEQMTPGSLSHPCEHQQTVGLGQSEAVTLSQGWCGSLSTAQTSVHFTVLTATEAPMRTGDPDKFYHLRFPRQGHLRFI